MKKIEFQSYLDCLYGGVQRRFFSNIVEISVQEKKRPIGRKSVKIPYAQLPVEQKKCCVPLDVVVAVLFLCC